MKRITIIPLSILSVVLLLASFPIRDVLDRALLSDICRIIGFLLIFLVLFIRLSNREKKQ